MSFETDQARAAENRAHRLTDADCHEWGEAEKANPLWLMVVVFVAGMVVWAVFV